nr:hypothetical protein CTI12_AA288430 [Tanacetum cinerariifolium]
FHEVSEFDDAKRSCRKGLARHNEVRRKQHEETKVSLLREGSKSNGSTPGQSIHVGERARSRVALQGKGGRYGSSSDEEEEGEHADPANQQRNQKYFELMDIPEDSQVKYVAYKLKGAASSWWDNLQTGRQRQRKQPILTWRKMKRVMFARFLRVDYEQTLYSLYQNCYQYSRTVSEYAEEFMRLASRNQLSEYDAQQVARFKNGLRYDIQAIVSLQTTWTIDEAVRIALKAEQTIKKQGTGSFMYKTKTDTNQSNSSQSGGDAKVDHSKSTHEVDGEKKKTTTTTTSTHAINKSSINPYGRPVSNKCFKCQEVGHTSNQCRATKHVNLAEGDKAHSESEDEGLIISSNAVFEDDDHSEVFLGLVRRLVLTSTKKIEDSQRYNTFQTRCKINQDVFNVIVDEGSN